MAFINYREYSSLSLVGVRVTKAILEALAKKNGLVIEERVESHVYGCRIKPEILIRFGISFIGDMVGVVMLEKRKQNDPDGQNQVMSAADATKKIEAATANVLAFLDFLEVERTEVQLYFQAGSCAFGD